MKNDIKIHMLELAGEFETEGVRIDAHEIKIRAKAIRGLDFRLTINETPIDMQPIKSTNITHIGYDDSDESLNQQDLYVMFTGGGLYVYKDVLVSDIEGILSSKSKGKFLNNTIKPNYGVTNLLK